MAAPGLVEPQGRRSTPEPVAGRLIPRPYLVAIGLTLAVWAPMLLWFAAFRPGIMTPDSLEHWAQATRGGWTDLHPPAYTALMWISAELVGSPSVLTLAQSLFLAAGIVAVARASARLGAPGRVTAVVTGALAVSPVVGALAVSLWKDVPYTATLLFATARLLDLLAARLGEETFRYRGALLSLAFWLALASVLRQNGLLFAIAALVLVLVLVPEVRRWCASLILALVVMVVAVKMLLFPVAGVRPSPAFATLATFSHDIAAVAASDPRSFSQRDQALLGRVAPFQQWRTHPPRFGCSSLNWIFSPDFHWDQAEGREGSYLGLWLELLVKHPQRVIGNRLCIGAVAWRTDTVGPLYTVSRGVHANDLGLETVPVSNDANRLALSLLDTSERVQWLAWRAPIWTYLAYLAIGAAAWRRQEVILLLAVAPLVAQQLSVLPLNPAQDARYMMFSLIYAPLLLPLAFSRLRRHDGSSGDAVVGSRAEAPAVSSRPGNGASS